MQPSRGVRSLKKLFAGYHQPNPLSAQQSAKLLDGLKTSFRDQLDREYGRSNRSPGSESASSASAKIESTPVHRQSAANHHLKSVLSNPLFSYEATAEASSLERDPMDVFDHAVFKGMMTLSAATGCLLAKNRLLHRSPEGLTELVATDVSQRVLQWLRCSRPDNDLSYLDNQNFIRQLVPFLVAGDLESVIWKWADQVINDTSGVPSDSQRCSRVSFLLSQLAFVKSQPQHGNLDTAIETLLDLEKSFGKERLFPNMLVYPWRSVSWLSTVESHSRTPPSQLLFDAHVNAAHGLKSPLRIEKAHLQLYHPTDPDPDAALRVFEDKNLVRNIIQRVRPDRIFMSKSNSMGILRWIDALGLDTINFLVKSGQSAKANYVRELLRAEIAPL